MDSSLILSDILNPPGLFFSLGMMAVFLKSDLEIPHPLPKLFSLDLLFAIGFKGGREIHESRIDSEIAITLLAAVIFKLKLVADNAAAIAASYGSISAVTFVTASSLLLVFLFIWRSSIASESKNIANNIRFLTVIGVKFPVKQVWIEELKPVRSVKICSSSTFIIVT